MKILIIGLNFQYIFPTHFLKLLGSHYFRFPFVQFIFTKEQIYMKEKCNQTQIDAGIFCEEAQEALNRIWVRVVIKIIYRIFQFFQTSKF